MAASHGKSKQKTHQRIFFLPAVWSSAAPVRTAWITRRCAHSTRTDQGLESIQKTPESILNLGGKRTAMALKNRYLHPPLVECVNIFPLLKRWVNKALLIHLYSLYILLIKASLLHCCFLLPSCVRRSSYEVAIRFSYLGSHARIQGVLILRGAHLLPPHHLLQTHIIIILEVAHAVSINMSLNLRKERRYLNTVVCSCNSL